MTALEYSMKPKKILLVEDNPSDQDLTKRALAQSQITNELVIAEDGQEALDCLFGSGAGDPPDPPAMILLDLKLPKVGGLDVLRRIRADARTKRIPIVVLTTSSEETDITAAYDLGVNSYIRKPVDFKKFVDAIQQLGLYWLVLNEPPPEPGSL
jgi:two-component system response regulator